MKLRFRSKPVILGFGLALFLLIGNFWMSYLNTDRLLDATGWQEHTENVIREIRAFLASVVDLESGSRGFALTGSESFLTPYHAALEVIPAGFAHLRKLTVDNPQQQRRLESLHPLVREKMAWTDGTISARREKGFEAAAALIETERGRELMAQIRGVLNGMEEEEKRLLVERELAVKAQTSRLNRTVLAGVALNLVLFLAVFIALEREVGERRRAEEQAARSEARLQAIFDHSPAIIYVQDRDGRIQLISRRFEEVFHRNAKEMIGKSAHDLFSREIADALRANQLRVLEGGAPLTFEETVPLHDGPHTYLNTRFPMRDADGSIYALGGVSIDITERKRAEEEARRVQAFLDSVVENLPNMIFVKEAGKLRFVRFNRAGEELLGHPRETLLGKNDYDLFPKEQADFFTSKDREVLESRNLLDIPEEPVLTKNGRRRFLHTKKVPLFDEKGRPEYLLGISEDITEHKQAREQIENLNRALELRAAQLEAANNEMEAFSYSVSHDLRAPLRSIDGFSQALLEDCAERLDERGKEHLQRVRAATQRMGQLIDDLLGLSRLSRAEMRRERVNLGGLAKRIAEELQRSDPARQVAFSISEEAVAEGDARLLSVALENLLRNAWKFTRNRPLAHIDFGTERHNGGRAFYVRDDGEGFDMRYADKLFGAFQRLHSSKDFEGTGIGLATVARIVHRHGGRVWAEGSVGSGATFHFTI